MTYGTKELATHLLQTRIGLRISNVLPDAGYYVVSSDLHSEYPWRVAINGACVFIRKEDIASVTQI